MSQYWESLASRTDGQYTSDELEMAAYRLVSEQVLYHTDRISRTAYGMIDRFERDYRQALAPLGIEIQVNRQLRYAFALPRHAKVGNASVAQTIFALILRAIYDEAARSGQLSDDGEVTCDLVELEEKYQLMSSREFPSKGRLDVLMESMKRWGIARKSDDAPLTDGDDSASGQPYHVIIRPAIADILGETALARLGQFKATESGVIEQASNEDNHQIQEEGA